MRLNWLLGHSWPLALAACLAGCDARTAQYQTPIPENSQAITGDGLASAGAAATAVSPPEGVSEILAEDDSDRLRAWATATDLAPHLRYAALRRLEQTDRQAAVEVARRLESSEHRLLQANSEAALSRAGEPPSSAGDDQSPTTDEE